MSKVLISKFIFDFERVIRDDDHTVIHILQSSISQFRRDWKINWNSTKSYFHFGKFLHSFECKVYLEMKQWFANNEKNASGFCGNQKHHAPTAIDYRKIFYSSFALQNLMILFRFFQLCPTPNPTLQRRTHVKLSSSTHKLSLNISCIKKTLMLEFILQHSHFLRLSYTFYLSNVGSNMNAPLKLDWRLF